VSVKNPHVLKASVAANPAARVALSRTWNRLRVRVRVRTREREKERERIIAGTGTGTGTDADADADARWCTTEDVNSRQRVAFHIATVLGLGDRLPAPGTTAGSLPAIIGWWLATQVLPNPQSRLAATLVGAVLVFFIGIWASNVESARRGAGDPGPVVIDEVVGQWLTMAPALWLLETQTSESLGIAAVAGFFLFRFFDIAKPWPVKRFEDLPGGLGIMADDVAAGILAAAVLALGIFLV
jgi:phosphatidylglycerophosphatase A